MIIEYQRNFLWGSEEGKRKMCWKSWDTICKPKEYGGLIFGVKNVFIFNDVLISKDYGAIF